MLNVGDTPLSRVVVKFCQRQAAINTEHRHGTVMEMFDNLQERGSGGPTERQIKMAEKADERGAHVVDLIEAQGVKSETVAAARTIEKKLESKERSEHRRSSLGIATANLEIVSLHLFTFVERSLVHASSYFFLIYGVRVHTRCVMTPNFAPRQKRSIKSCAC